METKHKKKGKLFCRFCGNPHGLIRKYALFVCRRCFRERAEKLGFQKYN